MDVRILLSAIFYLSGLLPRVLLSKINKTVVATIFDCPNRSAFHTRRGKRAGRRKQNRIRAVIGHRPHRDDCYPRLPCALAQVTTHRKKKVKKENPTSTATPTHQTSTLRIGLLNTRSCRNKTTEVADLVVDHQIDVMFITETWLQDETDKPLICELTPHNYLFKSFQRENRKGGGIAIIYKSILDNNVKLSRDIFGSFEHAELSLSRNNCNLSFHCIYRPPPSVSNHIQQRDFLDEFREFVSHTTLQNKDNVFLGDFNIDYNGEKPEPRNFRELLQEHDLLQHVDSATNNHGHIIDHVITSKDFTLSSPVQNIDKLISDHHLLFFNIPFIFNEPKKEKQIISRDIKNMDVQSFKNDLTSKLANIQTINAKELNTALLDTINHLAPLKIRTVKERLSSPWFNTEVKEAKKERRKAESEWRKSGLQTHKELYLIHKKKVNNISRKAKRNYYHMKFSNVQNSKEFFSISDELLGKQRETTLPSHLKLSELPTEFGKYFKDKISNIRSDLEDYPMESDFCPFSGDHLLFFKEVTESEVLNCILSTASKTCELDPIKTDLFKLCLGELAEAVTNIFNESLKSGVVPDVYKIALVKPILKKSDADKENFKNYRPISNLSFLSKVLERIVFGQLLAHLKKNALEETFQSAYKKNHSTETALVRVVNDLLKVIDQGSISTLNLLDLSAAFDTIDHEILLKRLEISYGISGMALDWFKSYLSKRKQIISVNGCVSGETDLVYGVPQGSVLGPVLFVLYIGPLSNILADSGLSYHQYADDTQLYSTVITRDAQQVTAASEKCILQVKEWMGRNRLRLNDEKTEFMYVGSRYMLNKVVTLEMSLGDNHIESLQKVKNLGTYFDPQLSMNNQVSALVRLLNFQLKKIGIIRPYISRSAANKLVVALMFSKLDYCNALLFGVSQDKLKRLQVVQNNAARMVLGKRRFEHASPLLSELHWLSIEKRIRFKASVLIYRCIENSAPPYLSELVHKYSIPRSLRSSADPTRLAIPRTRTKIGTRSFSHFGPSTWNAIPQSIRQKSSLDSFKKALKTYLFS